MNLYWLPAFADSTSGHGGNHRTAQIGAILEDAGLRYQVVDGASGFSRARVARLALARALRTGHVRFGRKAIGVAGRDWATLSELARDKVPPGLVLWESTSRLDLARRLLGFGHRLIALPHNIESLVPDGRSRRRMRLDFDRELEVFGACDAVFTISHHEAWLLRVHGIDARCLAYRSPPALRERLERIRAGRRTRPVAAGRHLVVGSCSNPPTRAGAQALLELLEEIPREACGDVEFVGSGTETLDVGAAMSNVRLAGRIDDRELDEMRMRCTSLLVHQPPTSGILTRVHEALHAGIPVIANEDAARGWESVEGVHVYASAGELEELLRVVLPMPPVPDNRGTVQRAFVARLQTALAND